jgi:hypothetical protein
LTQRKKPDVDVCAEPLELDMFELITAEVAVCGKVVDRPRY